LNNNFLNNLQKGFLKRKLSLIGLLIFSIFIFLGIFGPLLIPYDPYKTEYSNRYQLPNNNNIFGTDWAGRDVFSRVLVGAGITLKISIMALCIGSIIGGIIGILIGYMKNNILKMLVIQFNDILLTFPFLVLAILITALLGSNLNNAIIAIGISRIPRYVRIFCLVVNSEKNKKYIISATSLGASKIRILFYHILPNILPIFLVNTVLFFALTIIAEATLSFIGIGAQPPMPSWGLMIRQASENMLVYPFGVIPPSIAILLVVLSANLMADGLREFMDPKLR
jgi:peptide/nickel transport system permease protein